MNMHLIDWGIVAALLATLLVGALRTRRYTRSVSAFLAAGRCGRRYVICVADGMAAVGVISLVWYFEQNYKVGYTTYWWGLMEGPAMIIMALSGWVIYRYRQTRAMTLAQFFEIRYSRRFRIFAGLVAFAAGVINFGIFPSIGARFFMALCGLPGEMVVLSIHVPTFPVLMLALLSISLLFVFLGGQIAVMVTDCLQGIFANVVFIITIVFLLLTFDWGQISEALLAAPAEESMVHPFHLGEESDFNFWYYVISVVIFFYGVLGWQGTQGYNCAAIDAHEAKMAGILKGWRFRVLMLIVLVVPICVRTLTHHPDYAAEAAAVNASLSDLDTEALRNQLRTPFALAVILPTGLLGLLCAAMLSAFISTHDTYLHSWGSILVQDVILPFRKKPFTPRQHLRLLRASIFGVAIFVFFFSLLFQHTQYIAMFCAMTASIFVGGAGSVIIGGLYWKRGTTAGAWAAMGSGLGLSTAGLVVKQVYPEFFLTGQEISFWVIVCAILSYVLVSLLGPGGAYDMDRMLHRGPHAIAGESSISYSQVRTWLERLGVSHEFTGADRMVTLVTLAWPFVWTVVFIAGTIYNLVVDVPSESWLRFWHVWTWLILAAGTAVTIWFSIGGIRDMRELFRRLRQRAEDVRDDGRVAVGHDGDEESPEVGMDENSPPDESAPSAPGGRA